MRVTASIPIANIAVDREPIGPATLALVDYIRNGGDIPAIHVQRTSEGQYKICDGRHRVLAHKLLGISHIRAHFALVEDPRVDSPLPVKGEGHVPQADGCSLPHGECYSDL